MRDSKRQKSNITKRKSVGVALLALTIFLSACGAEGAGESEVLPTGAVQLENIQSTVEAQTDVSEVSREADGEAYRTEDRTQEEPATASSEQPDSTPEPEVSLEPIEEKLTPEGVGWGLSFGEPGTQPVGNASPRELALYNAYFLREGEEKVIYLTFDCGYENGNTGKILDALKAHDAPATFFVVGHFLETEPELVQRMVEDA